MKENLNTEQKPVTMRVRSILLAVLTLAGVTAAFAQTPQPATVTCYATGKVLVAQPVAQPYPGATHLRVQFYVWDWDGAAWQGGWTEAFDYQAGSSYAPLWIEVVDGYHRVTTRYQWWTGAAWTTPDDVHTPVYWQSQPSYGSNNPIAVPPERQPQTTNQSSDCYTG